MVQREEEFLNGIEDFGSAMEEINKENELLTSQKEEELKSEEENESLKSKKSESEENKESDKKKKFSFSNLSTRDKIVVGFAGIGLILTPILLYLVLSGALFGTKPTKTAKSTPTTPTPTSQPQTTPQPTFNTNTMNTYNIINKEKLIEEIKAEIMKDIDSKLESQKKKLLKLLENLKSRTDKLEKEINKGYNEISQNKQDIKKNTVNIKLLKEEMENLKETLNEATQTIKNLEEINKPLKTQNLISLGSLKVDYYTDAYITLNGNNYWIGDKLPLVIDGKTKYFRIEKIKNGIMVLEDDFGNKYEVKLII
jgi:DNA repair exonuclease SbcCD ATPase subunit